jgi:hypothetical protein
VLKHPSHKQRATNATGVGNGACLAIPPTLPSKLHCDRTDDHVTVAAARRAPAAAPQSLPNPRAHSVAAPASGAGWRSTLIRCSALGHLITRAGVSPPWLCADSASIQAAAPALVRGRKIPLAARLLRS